MTVRFERLLLHSPRARTAVAEGASASRKTTYTEPCLTVPLLCWRGGLELEGCDQIHGGLTQAQAVQRGPQVDDVALVAARLVEALEDVVAEVDAEGASAGVAAVDRTGAT